MDGEINTGNNEDCTGLPDPEIDLEKTVDGPAVQEMDGTFTVTYTVRATNNGQGPGMYDLVDTFNTGTGITLNGLPTAVYSLGVGEDDNSGTPGAYPNFVTGESLAADMFEEWVVTANFNIDPLLVVPGTQPGGSDCDARPGTPVAGTGFYNAIAR